MYGDRYMKTGKKRKDKKFKKRFYVNFNLKDRLSGIQEQFLKRTDATGSADTIDTYIDSHTLGQSLPPPLPCLKCNAIQPVSKNWTGITWSNRNQFAKIFNVKNEISNRSYTAIITPHPYSNWGWTFPFTVTQHPKGEAPLWGLAPCVCVWHIVTFWWRVKRLIWSPFKSYKKSCAHL